MKLALQKDGWTITGNVIGVEILNASQKVSQWQQLTVPR
ncbi:hypothetical protein H6G02_02470 [Leptolyngbya sp. FACHB-16]|nr:hypothetical protein [Leptolyngbya sp. FACHB-8]MBD2153378.1 hypothetical protein [Leptolyngbya sp. FACHB-16]